MFIYLPATVMKDHGNAGVLGGLGIAKRDGMETMTAAIQILETARDQQEAMEIVSAVEAQDGVTHIRVLAPSPAKPTWRVQAIMETNGDSLQAWLPDGMRHVVVSEHILAAFRAARRQNEVV